MVAPLSTKILHLRMGIESGPDQHDGVIVFDDIPVGATVQAWVDRPCELNEESDLHLPVTEVVSSGGRTLTFADANPDTITASAGDFLADGLRPGMRVAVDSPLNAGVYLIAEVTATVLTLVATEALVAEGPLSGGETLNGLPGVVQPYTFELAPPPAPFALGGVTFDRTAFAGVPPHVPAGANPSSRQRVIVSSGTGPVTVEQHEPAWAPFATPVSGRLTQRGRGNHQMVMPGHPSLTPELPPGERNFLRLRWTGSPVAGATLVAAAGSTSESGAAWANAHERLVPGSVVVTLPTAGGPLLDNGKGRLVGPGGDGTIDYITGAYTLNFGAAQTGNVLVDYEHECLYRPLDVTLTFDPLQAQ